MVDPEQVQDGGVQVVHVDLVARQSAMPMLVRFAVDDSAFDAAAGQPDGETVAMMSAAVLALACTGVRPNSVAQTMSVSSSMPRCFRSLIRAAIG